MKKVIIIDDEAPARTLLKQYLSDYDHLIIVGEANNGVDAIKIINEYKPDLIFLDIQMPGLTGFQVLPHLEEMPQVIFSTAYDQYALEAFEVHAVDYLLKPYTKERFARAVQRIEAAPSKGLQSLTQSLLEANQTAQYPTKILVQAGNKLITIDTEKIIWVSAEKDYARLITAQSKHLSNYGIGQLATKLDPKLFLRVHRSSIININFIEEIFKYASSYDIKMKNGDVVRVSRSYLDVIKKLTF